MQCWPGDGRSIEGKYASRTSGFIGLIALCITIPPANVFLGQRNQAERAGQVICRIGRKSESSDTEYFGLYLKYNLSIQNSQYAKECRMQRRKGHDKFEKSIGKE